MILYFCSKIIEENLTSDFRNSDYYYPVIYPNFSFDFPSKKEVLFHTIKSYSHLNFSKVIFHVEFDNESENAELEFANLVYSIWPKEITEIKFQRASTLDSWRNEVLILKNKYPLNEPVLVAMNHDHVFVDHNPKVLFEIAEKVFEKGKSNFRKALYYSHAPEVIKWSIFGRGNRKFNQLPNGIFHCKFESNWIDSIVILTFQTLHEIWETIVFSGNYIGRFDWVNVKFKGLALELYSFPREFFRHFDGYNHTTGVRFTEPLSLNSNLPFEFPSNRNIDEIVSFYYQLWLANYLQFVESYLENNSFSLKAQKTILIEAIQKSMELFNSAYLDMDVKYGLLPNEQKNQVQIGLHNLIYYNANSIYRELKTDIQLKSNWLKSPLYRLKSLIYNLFNK